MKNLLIAREQRLDHSNIPNNNNNNNNIANFVSSLLTFKIHHLFVNNNNNDNEMINIDHKESSLIVGKFNFYHTY